MKYTHKLLVSLGLIGFSGLLVASIGTGGAVVSGQTTPGGATVGPGGEAIAPGGAIIGTEVIQPDQFEAILENKTKHPIGLGLAAGRMVNLFPGKKMRVSFSPQDPTIYLNYLGKPGFIAFSAEIVASGAAVRTFKMQHPALNILPMTMTAGPIIFVITEK